ncbi:MAG: type 1 glutamine amidotransferase [Rhodobacteraceae bacterium]|nr:type 1 glutamine amidotransferase [Paracoccaceae bacterium]
MKIGILQTGLVPTELVDETGEYHAFFERMLEGRGFTFAHWSVVEDIFPHGPEAADGWLITGSRHGAYEDLPWIARLENLIRAIYGTGKPLIGVCFGHQIIAQALGGWVEKFEGGWNIGRQTYSMDGRDIALHAWHQDQVRVAPEDAKTIASNASCAHAALIYGTKAFTVQPHPEYGADYLDGLIRFRGTGIIPDDQLAEAKANLGKPVDNAVFADQFTQFFKTGSIS